MYHHLNSVGGAEAPPALPDASPRSMALYTSAARRWAVSSASSASAMAAAFVADARGYRSRVTENAAEVALEHHLGITCDPVQGYVQIPCIERNAMGAIKAYNAAVITSGTDPYSQRVSLDAAIAAMAETGREMSCKFKETSLGGLAVSMVAC